MTWIPFSHITDVRKQSTRKGISLYTITSLVRIIAAAYINVQNNKSVEIITQERNAIYGRTNYLHRKCIQFMCYTVIQIFQAFPTSTPLFSLDNQFAIEYYHFLRIKSSIHGMQMHIKRFIYIVI